jgi:hypothetical protein
MKNIVRIALVSVALAAGGQAFAAGKAKAEPNCEVKGKKTHVKDEKACTAKKGTWTGVAAAPAAPAPAAPAATDSATSAPAPAAEGAAPAPTK